MSNEKQTRCERLGVCMHTQRACPPGQCVGPETILPLDPYPDTDSADEFLHIAAALALVGLAVALGAGLVGYFVGGM